MTPAERAREIDKQEFAAECAAVRQRAFAYIEQRRHHNRCEIANWLGRELPKMVYRPRRAAPVQQPPRTPHKRRGPGPQHTIDGVSLTLREWAESIGISHGSLHTRITRLGSLEAAVAMGGPQRIRHERETKESRTVLYTYRGQRWLLAELADITGISAGTINARIASGWTVEQAIGTPTPKQRRAGVVSNLPAFEGTGAGGTAQETPNITFSESAACPQ